MLFRLRLALLLLLCLTACAGTRTHPVADSGRTDVVYLDPKANGYLPAGFHFAEHFRLRWGTLFAIRADGATRSGGGSIVIDPRDDMNFLHMGPPAYLPAGVMVGDKSAADLATHGILSPCDCDRREAFPISAKPGWMARNTTSQDQEYRKPGCFADIRLRQACRLEFAAGQTSVNVSHPFEFNEAEHRLWLDRAMNWLTKLPRQRLCGLALIVQGIPKAFDVFGDPDTFAPYGPTALSLMRGYIATDVFGDFAPDAADWTVSRLENLSLMSFWENACLADVIARLRGRGLHLAASYEIDDQSESTSPAGRHDTATLLAYLESEQGATWVLNGGLLTLVSSETGLSVQSGMGGTFSSIFGTDYKFAHRGVSEDASFNALGDFQVFNEESEQDVDQAAELHKRLLAELDTLLNFSPKTEPEALDAVNCANACLIALHHAHPLLLAEPDRRLYALRAQLLLAQARDVLHVYRPNAYTLVHPFLSLDGHTLEVARNAYSGEIFQYTWLGD